VAELGPGAGLRGARELAEGLLQRERVLEHPVVDHATPTQPQPLHTLVAVGSAIGQWRRDRQADCDLCVPRPASDEHLVDLERQTGKALGSTSKPGEERLLAPQVGTECRVTDEAEPHVVMGHLTGGLELTCSDATPRGPGPGSNDHPIHAATLGEWVHYVNPLFFHAMARGSFGTMHCSMARALDVIGDPWTPLVLRDLYLGLTRFDELADDLGVARNLLARRLGHLVERGVVERRPYQHRPPRYDYRLTESGRELVPILMALTAWGDRWVGPQAGPPIQFRHACGKVVEPAVTCPACRRPLTLATVTPLPGPGHKSADGTRLVGVSGWRPPRSPALP
jgi:DNA-binding HxlR family transcriptional regulator